MTAEPDLTDVTAPLLQHVTGLTMALARRRETGSQADTDAALAVIQSMIRCLRDVRHRLLVEARASQARDYQDVVDRVGGKP